MRSQSCPHDLLHRQLDTFEEHLAGVWDAAVESVHDARVATRRIRDLLAVLASAPDDHGELRESVKKAGRALGRVRELDVMAEHLRRTGVAVPALSPLASGALESLAQSQDKQRRKMIDQLEALDIDRVVRKARRLANKSCNRIVTRNRSWVAGMWDNIDRHAERVKHDLDRSSGVYIADRAHEVRISTKKLRYAVEVAVGTGQWRPPHLLKDLRRIQGVLGDVHDGQVLLDHLPSLVDEATPGRERLAEMQGVIDADIHLHYRKYLACRERLAMIADVCQRRSHRRPWWRRLAA